MSCHRALDLFIDMIAISVTAVDLSSRAVNFIFLYDEILVDCPIKNLTFIPRFSYARAASVEFEFRSQLSDNI